MIVTLDAKRRLAVPIGLAPASPGTTLTRPSTPRKMPFVILSLANSLIL